MKIFVYVRKSIFTRSLYSCWMTQLPPVGAVVLFKSEHTNEQVQVEVTGQHWQISEHDKTENSVQTVHLIVKLV